MLIGFYKENNPIKNTRWERLISLSKEAIKYGDQLIVFSLNDVDFDKKKIKGYCYDIKTGKYRSIISPFPDVIINDAPKLKIKRNPLENKLREQVPFTCYLIGNKFNLYNRIRRHAIYDSYLIPTQKLTTIMDVKEYLDTYNTIIIKPLNSRQGKGIYKIQSLESSFIIQNGEGIQKLNEEDFDAFIDSFIQKGNYIVQRFVQCTTKEGNAYDFRIHTQRNGQGEWVVTKLYPRIGKEDSFLSNISQGGYTEEIDIFLEKELGSKASFYKFVLNQLSLDLSEHIDSFYDFTIDELGIDLAIDIDGEVWFYEANAGPQSKYHEEERAVNTIAYAKYVADSTNKKQSNFVNKKDTPIRIGLLSGSRFSNKLKLACAAMSSLYNAEFCFFDYKDMNFNNKEVRTYFHENGKWTVKYISYKTDLDVIYDRLRMRGRKGFKEIYKELSHLPFNNDLYGASVNKLDLYNKLSNSDFNPKYMIPYSKAENNYIVNNYLDEYNEIILKPTNGTFGESIIFVKKIDETTIEKVIDSELEVLSNLEWNEYLDALLSRRSFIVQKFIQTKTIDNQPFDLRAHLMKNGENKWSIVNVYPRIGVGSTRITPTGQGGYIGAFKGFLKRNFKDKNIINLQNEIYELIYHSADILEKLYIGNVSEIGLDIAIDSDGALYLIEANLNRPGVIYYEFDLAKNIIPYTIFLAEKNRKITINEVK